MIKDETRRFSISQHGRGAVNCGTNNKKNQFGGVNRMWLLRYGLVVVGMLTLVGCKQAREFPYSNGFAAKNVCTGVFVAGIDEDIMRDEYVAPNVFALSQVWQVEVDYANRTVTSRDLLFNDQYQQTAYYRPGFGCTLLQESTTEELDQQLPRLREPVSLPSSQYWPRGTAGVWPVPQTGIDYRAIDAAIDKAFAPSPDYLKQTMAVVVAHNNRLIAERYADTVSADTRLLGWSMTKSFTATFIGMLHERGLLDIQGPTGIPEWQGTDKAAITIEDLLQMASGIDFTEEATGPANDLSVMLHATGKFSDFVLDRPLVAAPGEEYNYSTADTMLLARIGHDALGGSMRATYNFLAANLFEPIGITDAVLEYDAAGYPGGGSYLSMKPRDWARLGLLYMNEGNWFGRQVFSSAWVRYATGPAPANSGYGAQIWLNTDRKRWPSLPEDTFAFLGHQEQSVFIIPSRQLVVVRMGFTFGGDGEIEELVSGIVRALPAD